MTFDEVYELVTEHLTYGVSDEFMYDLHELAWGVPCGPVMAMVPWDYQRELQYSNLVGERFPSFYKVNLDIIYKELNEYDDAILRQNREVSHNHQISPRRWSIGPWVFEETNDRTDGTPDQGEG